MSDNLSISVIIPTLNAQTCLHYSLPTLAQGALEGVIKELIIADGGSEDLTIKMAEEAGAVICKSAMGRGTQMRAGAQMARGDWLLFLHADTQLSEGWIQEVRQFMARKEERAAVFRLKFDKRGLAPALVAGGAMIRTRIFGVPYGDQGLFIPRGLYQDIGGFKEMVLFEDVDILRRLKRKGAGGRPFVFKSYAKTSAARYEKRGYIRRVLTNFCCVMMYCAGVPVQKIAPIYYVSGNGELESDMCNNDC